MSRRSGPAPAPLLLVLALAACAAPGGPAAVADPPAPVRHEIEDRGFDALHYSIALTLDARASRFDGAVEIVLLTTRRLERVVLDAADMTVLMVEAGGVPARFRHSGPRLTIELPEPVAAGRSATVRVEYRVEHPLGGVHFSLPAELGTAHVPQVYTQGEDERARFWLPCVDAPHERATHQIALTVPLSWETAAAGRQVGREAHPEESTATWRWEMDRPMPAYLFTFAAGPFVRVEDRWEDVPLIHWVEPEDVEAAKASFAATADVLAFLSDYTGVRYPYPKYGHVAVRDFPFGGMENVSVTTVTRGALRSAAEQELQPTWGLVAHEAAHQWFGDLVTCATWPHAWLNEGFATYFGNLYQRHAQGEQAFLLGYGGTLDGYLDACRDENLRALVKQEYRLPMDLFFDGTIYPGGASRLQLLRGMLGEDRFRAGIALYLQRNAFQSVTTDAFEAAMSEAAGRDLHGWFAQWVHSPGYPEVEVEWRLDGAGDARVALRQTQSARGVPQAFSFPLQVRWWEGDSWRVRDLEVDEREESWTLDLGAGFQGFLEVDPNAWVPARWTIVEAPDATRARAVHARSSRVRALACRDLAAAGDAAAAGALWEVALRDEQPGLRGEAAGLLRRLLDEEELPRFVAAWRAERTPAAKAAWWRAICGLQPAPAFAVELMRGVLEDPAAPAGDRAAALRGVAAALSGAELRALLEGWAADAGAPDALRLTAIGELGAALPDGATRGFLLPFCWKGNDTTLRSAALRALEHWLDGDPDADPGAASVVDAFRRALLSPSAVLRRAAAEGAAARPGLFVPELRELRLREPDARTRRVLEAGR